MDWLFDTINWLFYSHGGLNDNSNIKKSRHGKFMYLAKDHTAHKWVCTQVVLLRSFLGCLPLHTMSNSLTDSACKRTISPDRFRQCIDDQKARSL